MIDVPVRVKDALRDGRRLKNYRFNVLNDDGTIDFTIENSNLVSESVKIDERMCTGNQLKFGLCEGSSLEFQYFDFPNITGRQIQAFIDVQYEDANGDLQWHSIPMGFFTVDQCPMQFATGIRKVTAYNKLRSNYLDVKCNDALMESTDDPTIQVPLVGIRNYFLSDYEVLPYNAEPLQPSAETNRYEEIYLYMKLTDDSDDTPLNKYNLGLRQSPGDDRDFYFCLYGTEYYFVVTPSNYYQFIEAIRRFSECIDNYLEYLVTLIDNSPVDKTGEDFLTALNATQVWKKIFSIRIQQTHGVGFDHYYSDYAYKHGIAGIDGTVNDLVKMLETDIDRVTIYFPSAFGIFVQHGYGAGKYYTEDYKAMMCGAREIRFKGQNTTTYEPTTWKTYPALTYSNGDIIPVVDDDEPYALSDWFNICEVSNITPADLVLFNPEDMPDFTLRDLVSASYETVCQYGQLDRSTDLFKGVELNGSRLLPSDTLYPADNLYPLGDSLRANKSMYQKLWTDSQGEQTFRYLIITYKGLDENNQEVEKVLQRTVNADGTTDYNMSDNWLFKNLVWSDADVGDYADAMVLKMQNISWFPFEMWCAGLPYLETGDELEITNSEGTYTSYVLQRQLNGIQNLQDTFIDGELDIF